MRKWIGKFKTISIQKKMAIAMLVTPVLSSLIILGFYYNYTREFYRVGFIKCNNLILLIFYVRKTVWQ